MRVEIIPLGGVGGQGKGWGGGSMDLVTGLVNNYSTLVHNYSTLVNN